MPPDGQVINRLGEFPVFRFQACARSPASGTAATDKRFDPGAVVEAGEGIVPQVRTFSTGRIETQAYLVAAALRDQEVVAQFAGPWCVVGIGRGPAQVAIALVTGDVPFQYPAIGGGARSRPRSPGLGPPSPPPVHGRRTTRTAEKTA